MNRSYISAPRWLKIMETALLAFQTTGMPWDLACQLWISRTNWRLGFVTPRAIFNGEKLWKRAAFCRNFLPNWFRVRFLSLRCVRNGPKLWHSSSRMNSRLWGSWLFQNRVIIAQVIVKNASRCNQFIVTFEAKRRFLVNFWQINGGWRPARPVYFCLKSSSEIATVSPEVLH